MAYAGTVYTSFLLCQYFFFMINFIVLLNIHAKEKLGSLRRMPLGAI